MLLHARDVLLFNYILLNVSEYVFERSHGVVLVLRLNALSQTRCFDLRRSV